MARLEDVFLYTVDDLARHVQTSGERRQAAVQQAEAIVNAGVDSFAQWLEQRATVPLIQALQRQTEDWRQTELTKARRALAKGADVDAVMETLSAALTRKMLHGALSELHGSAGPAHAQWMDSVQTLVPAARSGAGLRPRGQPLVRRHRVASGVRPGAGLGVLAVVGLAAVAEAAAGTAGRAARAAGCRP